MNAEPVSPSREAGSVAETRARLKKAHPFLRQHHGDVILQIFDDRECAVRNLAQEVPAESETIAENTCGEAQPFSSARSNDVKSTQRQSRKPGVDLVRGALHLIAALHGLGAIRQKALNGRNQILRHDRIRIDDQNRLRLPGQRLLEAVTQGEALSLRRRIVVDQDLGACLAAPAARWYRCSCGRPRKC